MGRLPVAIEYIPEAQRSFSIGVYKEPGRCLCTIDHGSGIHRQPVLRRYRNLDVCQCGDQRYSGRRLHSSHAGSIRQWQGMYPMTTYCRIPNMPNRFFFCCVYDQFQGAATGMIVSHLTIIALSTYNFLSKSLLDVELMPTSVEVSAFCKA